MTKKTTPGLGELLRYVGELVEQGGEERYRALDLEYRARYTPVMRALAAGAETVTEIVALSHLTQGAISQSVSLMSTDGLIGHHPLDDGRKNGIHLTEKGKYVLAKLEPHWEVIFRAIGTLEHEVGFPLLQALQDTAKALERKGFAERLREAEDDR
ncbi:MarR family winged helix-turn-helix transcriptional regulator [uncultured Nitratireductor sp.]|uniref:MarR family winged helix-turn-helix transcriptional regulator n=1 Tax=uncultured Nitratireductor sp. TaxID=520953 RepID=UPI0025DC0091|nr:MarR family winged helix-turn-helix transcriptional regulator [uncultured Nitratireductor sp.]